MCVAWFQSQCEANLMKVHTQTKKKSELDKFLPNDWVGKFSEMIAVHAM